MGNSAQQHRVAIGCYQGNVVTSSWVPCPKSRSQSMKKAKESQSALSDLQSEIYTWWILQGAFVSNLLSYVMKKILPVITVLTITHLIYLGVENMFIDPTSSNSSYVMLSISDHCMTENRELVISWFVIQKWFSDNIFCK